jgi:hypothetical protein
MMAQVSLYFGAENLALTNAQRNNFRNWVLTLGQRDTSPYPNERMQPPRIRLDNQAMIFEATFEDSHITAQAFINRLGVIFGVDPATITATTTSQTWGGIPNRIYTFRRNSTNYLRCVMFGFNGGGSLPSWDLSNRACLAYLAANAAEWETAL